MWLDGGAVGHCPSCATAGLRNGLRKGGREIGWHSPDGVSKRKLLPISPPLTPRSPCCAWLLVGRFVHHLALRSAQT